MTLPLRVEAAAKMITILTTDIAISSRKRNEEVFEINERSLFFLLLVVVQMNKKTPLIQMTKTYRVT